MATVELNAENFESTVTGGGLYAQPGALPEQALEQLITKARELDMDEVRRTLAQPAAS